MNALKFSNKDEINDWGRYFIPKFNECFLLGCMFPCVIYKKVGYFESGCFKKQLISSAKNVIKQGTFF